MKMVHHSKSSFPDLETIQRRFEVDWTNTSTKH